MKLNWVIFGSSAAASLVLLSAEGFATPDDCLLGLKPALVSGDFSGSVNCEEDQLSVRKVGDVRTKWDTFTVYSYHYKLKPVCPECAIHGGHRIIFVEQGVYVGQYKSDVASVSIENGSLVFDATYGGPVTVEFTANGPPDKLLVDGELINFFK